MQKTFNEKKEIDVAVRRTVCDVCGETMKEGTARLRLSVAKEQPFNDYEVMKVGSSNPDFLDICSTSCLKKNLGGAILVLETKMIPQVLSEKSHPPSFGVATTTSTINAGYITSGTAYSSSVTPTIGYAATSNILTVDASGSTQTVTG